MGKAGGVCGGRGGSMHVSDMDLGILGANGIVGPVYLLLWVALSLTKHETQAALLLLFW